MAGVNTDGNGLSWLTHLTDHKEIKFLPISNDGSECVARVYISRENEKDLDAGISLVKMGFAKAVPFPKEIILKDKSLMSYYNRLKNLENRARSSRKGQWHMLPENWLMWKLRTASEKLVHQITPSKDILPQVLRLK